ncbi:MAG: hypothetical protein WC299_04850, partial [Kiritimatiellia bacterium]
MKFLLYCFLVIPALAAICAVHAAEADTATNMVEEIRQLRSRIEVLEKKLLETNQPAPSAREAPEPAAATLEAIRKSARDEIDTNAVETNGEKEFTFGALGLQALNPEISITGDMLASYTDSKTTNKKCDFLFRGLGLHFESYLDPYTRFKAAVPVDE